MRKRTGWNRIAAAALCLVLMLPSCSLAEPAQSWLYSFSAGEVLSGEGMEGVREFLDAVQLELSTQRTENRSLGRVVLLSDGKSVFFLRAADSGEEDSFGLACSLTGNCTLMCRKDQLDDFLLTLVQMLSDVHILKDESLEQSRAMAVKVSDMLLKVTEAMDSGDPNVGIDLQMYMDRVGGLATAAEVIPLHGEDPECPGAAVKRIWNLSEEDLNSLVEAGLDKIARIPVLSDALRNGTLRIGTQTVTDTFIRELFASMHGESVLVLYENADGSVLRLSLQSPDISDLVTDPMFARIRGIDIAITRNGDPDAERRESVTAVSLVGLEGSLLSVRMEKKPGTDIESLPAKVYQVGEMNSRQLLDLVLSLGLTISRNAINMIMDLPRIVFDTLVDRLF